MKKLLIITLILSLFTSGCASTFVFTRQNIDYKIRVSDELRVVIWEELDEKVIVRSDKKISLLRLQKIQKRIVQAQGIHLKRLVYLTGEEFKFLRLLRKRFLKKISRFFPKQPKADALAKKQALGCPRNEDLRPGIDNYTSCYEPTNIVNTRDSLFWRWRRVKEYYKEFLDMDGNDKEKELCALMYR